NIGAALAELGAMADAIPLDAPWNAENAAALDRQSLGQWIGETLHVPSDEAREAVRSVFTILFCCDPAEVSLLHLLFFARSNGGLQNVLTMRGGAEDSAVDGT